MSNRNNSKGNYSSSNKDKGGGNNKGGNNYGKTTYQQQLKGNYKGQGSYRVVQGQTEHVNAGRRETQDRTRLREEGDFIDEKFGFFRYDDGPERLGWLLNYLPISMPDEYGNEKSGLDLYFLDRQGGNFKATIFYRPYFYVDLYDSRRALEISQHIQKKFEGCFVDIIEKEDLSMPGHLSGKKHKFLKLSFGTVNELMDVKNILKKTADLNNKRKSTEEFVNPVDIDEYSSTIDPLACLSELREYDVPYTMRVAIDMSIRVGSWYYVKPNEAGSEGCTLFWQKDMLELCEPRILAYDIECEKSPLKFPNAEVDRIYMISYMIAGQGYLIVNRDIVSKDIEELEYTPMSKFPGPFKVMNEKNEEALIRRFMSHIQELKPHVMVTYNGDFFDMPYVETRAMTYGISMYKEIGIRSNRGNGDAEFIGRCIVHLDAFRWVQRDSYLPQGSQGLKSVTKEKLKYNPAEIDPEDMLKYAREQPDKMAEYSVSDAVATYYLYKLYVHNFIFSMSTIIPMGPEDVLRKGSGTLCEALLMVEAFLGNIVYPNKQVDPFEKFDEDGHLLESETYIGGHVECLEAGVFRADIPAKFELVPSALSELINNIDRDLTFALETEHDIQRFDIINYDEVRQAIVEKLEMLRDNPNRLEKPAIYHLDVGAMYPNIILTNRLQPSAIVSQIDCASCEYNKSNIDCKRPMDWTWRGEYNPATKSDINSIKRQLSYEKVGDEQFNELPEQQQAKIVKQRLKQYANKVYKKTKVVTEKLKTNTVCMRENPFYVNTVRTFRDRRYDYKLETKKWKNIKDDCERRGDVIKRKDAEDKEVLSDSLQLAHKCILNSFYGYVMRKGARWRSIEMAGIVTHTGSNIIKQARELVEQVGRPLELDTDGIWCILPASFPQDFVFKTRSNKKIELQYPCAMLNADVHEHYTNNQYSDKDDGKYSQRSECSIFFELDGPYKAMVLPASPEEGVLLKKKYVVFNFDGSIKELKGFELKRRGELQITKNFQESVFEKFLEGASLIDCYKAVGNEANVWLDVLAEQGVGMNDEDLLELISERKTISKTLEDMVDGGRKATSITTASRIADFLGAEMVKDKGLNFNLIISKYPTGLPVTERAIPVAIFSAEPAVRRNYLRKWLKDPSLDCTNLREIVDWDYYIDRLGKSVQKIITIPAGLQGVPNPCPRVEHPDWLQRKIQDTVSGFKQKNIMDMFKGMTSSKSTHPPVSPFKSKKRLSVEPSSERKRKPDNQETNTENVTPNIDMEDMFDNGTKVKKSLFPTVHFKPNSPTTPSTVTATVNITPIVEEVAPPIITGASALELQEWLKSRKSAWRKLRKERRMGEDEHASKKNTGGVMDFVRNATIDLKHKSWQIVELQQTDIHGEFIVWAMTSKNQIQRVTVVIDRSLYINCRTKEAVDVAYEMNGYKVAKDLPHSRKMYTLVEVQIPERKFQTGGKKISQFLSLPEIEGVYESKVPLWFRGVLNLGCVARLSRAVIKSGMSTNRFKLKDLEFVSVRTHSYLTPSVAEFKQIFLYYTPIKLGNRQLGVLSLFIVDQSEPDETYVFLNSAKAFVWIVNGGNSTLNQKPPFQRFYREKQRKETAQVKFLVNFVNTVQDAYKACNDRLESYIRERHPPTIVIAQGIFETRQWRRNISLLKEFPLVTMPANAKDEMFPAVGWQTKLAKTVIERFLEYPENFATRLEYSRFAHVPVCNLGSDPHNTIIDVLFGRKLQQHNHLLWASESSIPDLGGAETDEYGAWNDEIIEQSKNFPGAYRSICVELDMSGLVISAIINSSSLDAEGLTSVKVVTSGSSSSVDGAGVDSSCSRAFNLLKSLVTNWIDEIIDYGDHTSGQISGHLRDALYRYLCGYGDALLQDPTLHKVIYILMVKAFNKITSELWRLGTKIVYADFRKLVIHTEKADSESAHEYIMYILGAVLQNSTFNHKGEHILDFKILKTWEQLIWLGPDNHGGLIYEEATQTEPQETLYDDEQQEYQVDDDDIIDDRDRGEDYDAGLDEILGGAITTHEQARPTVSMDQHDDRMEEDDVDYDNYHDPDEYIDSPYKYYHRWSMATELIPEAQRLFERYMSKFLHDYQDLRNEVTEVFRSSNDASIEEVVEKMRDYIDDLSEEFMRFIDDLRNGRTEFSSINKFIISLKMKEYIKVDLSEELMNDIDDLKNNKVACGAITQFVVSLSHVFLHDKDLYNELATLKRMLLAQLQVRDFSEDSQFHESDASYILRDVICSFCSTCKDIDLIHVFDDKVFNDNPDADNRWKCECGNIVDLVEIENRLLDDVKRLCVSHQVQDLRCASTHMVSSRLCASHSELSRPLVLDQTIGYSKKKLSILQKVGQLHNFELLQDTIKDAQYFN